MVDLLTVGLSVALSGLVAALIAHRERRGPQPSPDDKPPLVTPCPQCDRAFKSRSEARDHLRDVHNAPGSEAEIDYLLGSPVELE